MFDRIRIIDGGMASQLEKIGVNLKNDPLWTARCIYTEPAAISMVHQDFIEAGCDVVITSSYQASVDGFSSHLRLSYDDSIQLIQKSVHLARKAADTCGKGSEVTIAGSVGSYGACLADGSEYSGSYMQNCSQTSLKEWHQPRIEALLEAQVDILAFETIPSLAEAVALLELLKNYPSAKAWLSFVCKDHNSTSYGDDFGFAVRKCYETNKEQLMAVGINCTDPTFITSLLTLAAKELSSDVLPRIIYPNSGEKWNEISKWEGDCDAFIKTAEVELKTWLSLGVKGIGGCCRVSPSHIKSLRDLIHLK